MVLLESEALFFIGFGFLVGILFGFFGLGGSFFVTPALLVLGHPAEAAVGSGLVFVFGTSLAAAVTHQSAGHIDYKLGGFLVLGMAAGIEVGRRILFWLAERGLADVVISIAYVVLLAVVGVIILRRVHNERLVDSVERRIPPVFEKYALNRLPPLIELRSTVQVSMWLVLVVGIAIGTLSGFLGVGGGFLMVPSLVYGMGISKSVAVGTDIFQIAGSSAFGSVRYFQEGAVHLSVVLPLLGGSIFGSYIGSRLTDIVDESTLMSYFAVMLLLDSVAVASKTISHTYDIQILHDLSLTLLFGTALGVAALIVYRGGRTAYRDSIG
ncbi:sulfite exporter TauE/SafE [Halalkalicoccus paucihalophilus]|uniref:Probable membrane transporter protein n=1 Tax=Halalkalicoccus paucihalophilus TaxID=1008153 RepID=A0A151AB43_9EURY|nr:sulfite exporter TauE/SafE family protein [Halalkalicoccus paucihalophilus]KYH24814.1 sulfite exporter TauE/SafE [Halalkalicoccus paucihalophilus]